MSDEANTKPHFIRVERVSVPVFENKSGDGNTFYKAGKATSYYTDKDAGEKKPTEQFSSAECLAVSAAYQEAAAYIRSKRPNNAA